MMKNFNIIILILLKNPIFRRGGVHEKTICFFWGVNRLKRGAWIVCRFKRGLGKKEKKKG